MSKEPLTHDLRSPTEAGESVENCVINFCIWILTLIKHRSLPSYLFALEANVVAFCKRS